MSRHAALPTTRGRRAARWVRTTVELALAAVVLALVAAAGPARAATPEGRALAQRLAPLVSHGGVVVAEDGDVVFRYGADTYVPASILKLGTALAALELLGPDYRFRTEVYRDGRTLYLRGYGDPLLVSEEWTAMAAELAARGVFDAPLEDLVLDASAFGDDLQPDGQGDSLNPYDAPLGALVANFNTVFVAVGSEGSVRSAEPQTPLTPTAERVGRTLASGEHRVNLAARGVSGLAYAGDLARTIFREAGATFTGRIRRGRVPAGLSPVLTHRNSRTLEDVVRAMMEFSNNFIANQLVLALALERRGEPATLAGGVAEETAFLRGRVGLAADSFTLVEGSGLSRANRVTLGAMLRITEAFHPWRHLLQTYRVGGETVAAKTGTLTGVYTLAGYLPAPDGVRRTFVIMLNQPRHTRAAVLRRLVAAFPAAGGG